MTDGARRGVARWTIPVAAVSAAALLVAFVVSGHWPEMRSKVAFASEGLLASAPADIDHIELRAGPDRIALHRAADGWLFDGRPDAVSAELAAHLETALRLLHVSKPSREFTAGELTAASFAPFGLDPPSDVAVLETRTGAATTVNFGGLNPAGTSHYVRLAGAPTVYLMGRHVGEEWQVALDMARRQGRGDVAAASRGAGLLLPVSMAQVWALEIVFAGKLTRFERDGAGNWFRHLGQHNHAAGSVTHVADPAQAQIIDAAVGPLDAAAIETRLGSPDGAQLARYGLNLPGLIVLFYARDSSTPLARLEFGVNADDLDRYARLAPNGAVVTVAEFEVRRLTELLKAVGEGS